MTPVLTVSQAPDGSGILWLEREGREPVYIAHRATKEAANALRKGCMAEFDRLVKLVPTSQLEAALSLRPDTQLNMERA